MNRALIGVFVLALASSVTAQDHEKHMQQYAGMQEREIKALSADEVEQLKTGAGMGFAQAAELNHYPGPKHVLELGEELGLTDEQKVEALRVFDTMKAAAVDLGTKIVGMETHLNSAFADGTIDDDSLARMTTHIGQLRGELRAVHLRAHLAMKRVLTNEQIAEYDRLRGY